MDKVQSEVRALPVSVPNADRFTEITSDLGIFPVAAFQDARLQDPCAFDGQVEELLEGLDEESVNAVKLFLQRAMEFLPRKLPNGDSIFYRRDSLLTSDEVHPYSSGKAAKTSQSFRREFVIGANKTYLTTTHYESGLVFLPEDVRQRLEGRAIVDAGAFWGDTACVFSRYRPAHIFAVEPAPKWFAELVWVIEANGLDELVTPLQVALGSENGRVHFIQEETTSHAVEKKSQESVEVTVVTVDEITQDCPFSTGLIKIDVEGWDLDVLQGAVETIKESRPVLITSMYHHPEQFFAVRKS